MKLQYGWVVVAAGALLGCVAMGSTFSLAVFLQPMSEATGWSESNVKVKAFRARRRMRAAVEKLLSRGGGWAGKIF